MNNRGIGVGVGVMLVRDDGKVFLHKRRSRDGDNGTWAIPGGNFEFGETFEQAGIREVKEETGVDITDIKVVNFHSAVNYEFHYVSVGLLATEWTGEPRIIEPHQHSEMGWFDFDNLPENLYLPTKKVIGDYKQGEFYLP